MKNSRTLISFALLVSFLFLFTTLQAQSQISIGANVGYSGLDMTALNNDLKAIAEKIENDYSNYSVSQEDVGGGLYFDGNVLITFDQGLTTGLSVNYISSSVEISGDIEGNEFSSKYDLSTIEILGVLGYKIPIGGSMSLPLRALVGYGLPSAELTKKNDDNLSGSGGYFAARAQAGIEFDLNAVVLNAFLGYRIANAGSLDFKNDNDKDIELITLDGDEMEFDYSGLLIGAGISIKL